jgi:hypothetical protein
VSVAIGLWDLIHRDLEAFGTGGGERLVDYDLKAAIVTFRAVLKRLGIDADIPFRNYSSWKTYWLNNDGYGSWRAFAGEQYTILRSDRRSFANLAARFPEPPAGDFFVALAQGESEALARLLAFGASLGIDEAGLAGYDPKPGCQPYTAFVSWLALNGSRADLTLALLANLAAWGENCRHLAGLLQGRCDISYFAEPAPGFEQQALGVADAGLGRLADERLPLRPSPASVRAAVLGHARRCALAINSGRPPRTGRPSTSTLHLWCPGRDTRSGAVPLLRAPRPPSRFGPHR